MNPFRLIKVRVSVQIYYRACSNITAFSSLNTNQRQPCFDICTLLPFLDRACIKFCLLISCLCVWPEVDLIFYHIKKPSGGFEVLRSIIFTWEISYLFWMSERSFVPAKVSVLRDSRHNVECCINIFPTVSSENETFGSFIIWRFWAPLYFPVSTKHFWLTTM